MSIVETTCEHCGERVSGRTLYCDDCRGDVNKSGSSFGLKVFAVVFAVTAIVALALNAATLSNALSSQFGQAAGIFAAINSFGQVGKLAGAYGLWKTKDWGYSLSMTIILMFLILSVITISIGGLLFYVPLFMYLRSKKDEFGIV